MVAQDRAVADVCGDDDMPGGSSLWAFAKANPDFLRALDAAWESLSFPTQAKAFKLGNKFKAAAANLRLAGKTAKEIGQSLGVPWGTVAHHISGVPCPPKTHCPQGHPYPKDEPRSRKCRICQTEYARRRKGHLPRAVAAKTKITVACFDCGHPTERSRLGGNRKTRCDECRSVYRKEYDRARDASKKV